MDFTDRMMLFGVLGAIYTNVSPRPGWVDAISFTVILLIAIVVGAVGHRLLYGQWPWDESA